MRRRGSSIAWVPPAASVHHADAPHPGRHPASLSRTPSELTAANVAAGGIATASMLVGLALAGLALAVTGSAAVFLGAALVEPSIGRAGSAASTY